MRDGDAREIRVVDNGCVAIGISRGSLIKDNANHFPHCCVKSSSSVVPGRCGVFTDVLKLAFHA